MNFETWGRFLKGPIGSFARKEGSTGLYPLLGECCKSPLNSPSNTHKI